MLRKGLSLLLCLCLCAGLVPAALAEEPVTVDVPLLTEEAAVAEIPVSATATLAAEKTETDGAIKGFEPLPDGGVVRIKHKLALVTLRQLFPKELTADLGGGTRSVPVTWKCAENYDEAYAEFHFTPVLENVTLADGVEPPVLTVVVEKERELPPLGGLIDAGKPAGSSRPSPAKRRSALPAYYNAYELGLLPPVKNQGQYGVCWAFSILGCMEADLIRDGKADTSIDLSELQLAYYANHSFYDEKGCNAGDTATCEGNEYLTDGNTIWVGYRTLANMVGCAEEADVPYSWGETYQPGLYAGRADRAPQLVGAYELPNYGESGRDTVKEAILQHGAVAAGIRMEKSLYSATFNSYYNTTGTDDHGVMLVGWDDDFPKENFAPSQPSADGAWLARNSWGGNALPSDVEYPDYGLNGYFWISYEDASVGESILYAFDAQDRQYDHCYGYDATPQPYGLMEDCPNPTVLSQNFLVDGGERIDAVGVETQKPDETIVLSLTCGDTSVTTQAVTGKVGFHLIPLTTPLTVKERSAVTLELTVSVEEGKPLDILYQKVGEDTVNARYSASCGSDGLVVNGENIGADGYLKLFTTDVEAQTQVGGIRVDEENFPLAAFRAYVSANFDADGNGALSEGERAAATEIDFTKQPGEAAGASGSKRGAQRRTLKGVEHFPALKTLICDGLHLTELDVRSNPVLETLSCANNELTALDVTCNPKLETLCCHTNALTELDLRACHALKTLRCGSNQLTVLDVSGCTALEMLRCGGNALTELDLQGSSLLTELQCYENKLTALDVSACTLLETLSCGNNALTGLELTHNPGLKTVDCADCGLTSLDLSQNPELEQLYCSENPLGGLDVTKNGKLTLLSAENCLLSGFEASGNPALERLFLTGNQLAAIDLSNNPELLQLVVSGNPLTELDISKNTKLLALECDGCGLAALDLSNNPALGALYAQENAFTRLELFDCAALYKLYKYCNPSYSELPGTVSYSDDSTIEAIDQPRILTLDLDVEIVADVPRIVTQPQSVSAYIGETVTFSVTAEGGDLTYQWYRLDPGEEDLWEPIEGATEPEYSFTVSLEDDGALYGVGLENKLDWIESDDVTVTVLKRPGDVSADGEVNAKDVTSLRRYIAGGFDGKVDETLVDVNRDGAVNAKDITFLRRALAGGYGVTLS